MNIGFDAKRAFHNSTGLGNYSRTLISDLSKRFTAHHYFLFNPKPSAKYKIEAFNIKEVLPHRLLHRIFNSVWRTRWIKQDILNNKIDLYHGLSHEIPIGLRRAGIKTIVTIHDLIFLRYPEQFSFFDRLIYKAKFKYACKNADHIIAISEQTKTDIIDFFGTNTSKITVCPQSCDSLYQQEITAEEQQVVKSMLHLPDEYMLYVGSIIERKGLLRICEAMALIKDEIKLPLVIIGRGRQYKEKVKQCAKENGIADRLIFLSESEFANQSEAYRNGSCLPAIYSAAKLFIYPSVYEGFGLPVLEAMYCKTPVITSNISSLPEVGGDAAYYVNPNHPEEIANGIRAIVFNEVKASKMSSEGYLQALKFNPEKCASRVMDVYLKTI